MRHLFNLFAVIMVFGFYQANANTPVVVQTQSSGPSFCQEMISLKSKCEGKAADLKVTSSVSQNPRQYECGDVMSSLPACEKDNPSADAAQCQEVHKLYLEAEKTKKTKCSKFQGCSETSKFQSCRDYNDDIGLDTDATEMDKEELYRSCPFLAKDDIKESLEAIETQKTRLEETEEKLQELTQKLKETREANETQMSELRDEIGELESSASKALSDMQMAIGDINEGSSEQISKARTAIDDLNYQIGQKTIAGTAKAATEYGKVVNEIEQKCYIRGMEAAKTEAAQLRRKSGVSSRKQHQIAAMGMIKYLRLIANQAYKDCQNSRLFKGPAEQAAALYKDQQKLVEQDINRMDQRMKSLMSAIQALPQQTNKAVQDKINQTSQEVQGLYAQIQAKKSLLNQLMASQYQQQSEIQMQIMAQQRKQFEEEKQLRALEASVKTMKRNTTPGTPNEIEYSEALAAVLELESTTEQMVTACCKDGRAISSGAGIASKCSSSGSRAAPASSTRGHSESL